MEKLELFSAAWAEQAKVAIQSSVAYQKSAATWQGAMVFTLQADSSLGVPENQSVYFDLHHGQCLEARVATSSDLEHAPYMISADAFTWQQVLTSKLEPIAGLLRGKLKLSKGSMAVLARYVMAAKEMVNCAARVPTIFPGEH